MEQQQQQQQQPQETTVQPLLRRAVVAECQRKSSIETEPRTLYEEQMAEAKDAAVDIIETKDPDEAIEIFTTPSEECVIPTAPTPIHAIPRITILGDQFEDAQMHAPIKLPSAPF